MIRLYNILTGEMCFIKIIVNIVLENPLIHNYYYKPERKTENT